MESLSRLLSDSEGWLSRRALQYSRAPGDGPLCAPLPEDWQESVAHLPRSLGAALSALDRPGAATAADSRGDPATDLAVEQARCHRAGGATLGMALCLLKLQRQCCRDLVAEAPFDEGARRRYLDALERVFDRVEVAFCLEWSSLVEAPGEETGERDRLELLKALSDRVRAGLPAGQVIAFAVSELARRYADHRVAYARLGEGTRLQVLQSCQPPGLSDLSGEEFDLSAHPRYLAELRHFMPVLSEEVSADPLYGTLGTQLAQGGAGATFDLPVRSGQDLAGVLCVAARAPHPWEPGLVRLLTQVGEILNGACEREAREAAEQALGETSLWLRGMFQALEEAVFLLTPSRELADCNPAAERMFQFNRRELEYLSPEALHIDRDHFRRFGAIMDDAFARDESATFEFRFRRKNGEVFPTEQTVALLRGDDGNSVGILAVVRDITERRRAEDALRDSEQRLLQIIDFLPDPTWVIDDGGRVVAWNRAIEAVTGVAAEDIVGEGDHAYAVPFYGCRRPVLIDLVSQPAAEWEARYLQFHRDGERLSSESFHPELGDGGVYLEATATPLYDGDGTRVGAIETVRDATARRRAEDELRRREQQYRTFFEGNHAVMLVVDPLSGAVVDANPAAAEYYGYGRGELTGMAITAINTLERDELFAEMEAARREERRYFLFRHRRADGSVRDVEVYSGPVQVRDRSMLFSIVHDVTDRHQAERALRASEERYRLIAESMSDYVYAARVEPDGEVRTEWVTGAFEAITGYSPHEVQTLERGFATLVHPEDADRVRSLGGQLLDSRPLLVEFRITRKDGATRWLRDHIRPLFDGDGGKITRLLGGVQDITDRKLLEEELHALATTDPLTGGLNRRRFLDRAREEFQAARRYGRELAFLMLDVDHFKRINDTHGHRQGDEVLRRLSRFCIDALRRTDLFGRIGGEEFAAVLGEAGPETAAQTAERIRAGLAAMGVPLPRGTLAFTVSGGLALLQASDADLEALMQRADEALYAAKRRGRNRVVLA